MPFRALMLILQQLRGGFGWSRSIAITPWTPDLRRWAGQGRLPGRRPGNHRAPAGLLQRPYAGNSRTSGLARPRGGLLRRPAARGAGRRGHLFRQRNPVRDDGFGARAGRTPMAQPRPHFRSRRNRRHDPYRDRGFGARRTSSTPATRPCARRCSSALPAS